MDRRVFLTGVASVLVPASLGAEAVPPRSRLDARIRVVRYVDGQVFVLLTSMTRATVVEFEEGERIVSIVAGDTQGFNFESVPGDRVFAIKAQAPGVTTNVIVYTDRNRSYYFTVRQSNQPFYALRFSYPERARQQSVSARREAVRWNYGVDRQNEITPVSVWDDGAFTYFQFRPRAPIPAVFKVTNGRERAVNSQAVRDRVLRVSGTSSQWAVRLGDLEVCIAEVFER